MKFRRRKPRVRCDRRAGWSPNSDICQLLDLADYEKPEDDIDEFRKRMRGNIAAAIFLGALVAIAVVDVVSLEQIQH